MTDNNEHTRSAVKFLMGLGCNPDLTPSEQRKLREVLVGPYKNGMTEAQARQIARAYKWSDT